MGPVFPGTSLGDLMILTSVLILSAATAAAPGATSKPALTAAEKAGARAIRVSGLRADVRFLAHDLLEGRGPGTRGDRLAQAYIAARMEAIGLEPGAPDGSWLQPFDLVSITTEAPPVLRAQRGGEGVEFRAIEDYAAESGVQTAEARI